MTDLEMRCRIYTDSNVWIYLIQGIGPLHLAARTFVDRSVVSGATFVTSELTVAECLYQPARDGESYAVASFDRLFGSGRIDVVPLDGPMLRRAAIHGGPRRLKLLDAVHHLTALEQRCQYLATGDHRFRETDGLELIRIEAAV